MPSPVPEEKSDTAPQLSDYKNLFGSFNPKDSLALIEKNHLVETAESAFKVWLSGARANSLAVIGNSGTGCSLAIEKLKQIFSKTCEVLSVGLDRYAIAHDNLAGAIGGEIGCGRAATMDDILKVINEGEQKVIFLQNCQNLFVRRVGGFDALYDLHHLLSFSRFKIFWVTDWGPYAWYYLDKTIGFHDFFDERLHFKAIDDTTILQWLQQRHDSTGYTAIYHDENKVPVNVQQGWIPEPHKKLLLHGARGNIKTAGEIWLSSIDVTCEKQIQVSAPLIFDDSILEPLIEEDLYILCSLLFHKEISLEYLSEDMNLTQLETRMRIDCLRDKNIVESGSHRSTFTISMTALTSVLKLLTKRNLINLEDSLGY